MAACLGVCAALGSGCTSVWERHYVATMDAASLNTGAALVPSAAWAPDSVRVERHEGLLPPEPGAGEMLLGQSVFVTSSDMTDEEALRELGERTGATRVAYRVTDQGMRVEHVVLRRSVPVKSRTRGTVKGPDGRVSEVDLTTTTQQWVEEEQAVERRLLRHEAWFFGAAATSGRDSRGRS
jgi:hypothetical protein